MELHFQEFEVSECLSINETSLSMDHFQRIRAFIRDDIEAEDSHDFVLQPRPRPRVGSKVRGVVVR